MAQGIFTLKQVNQAIRQGAWSAFNPPKFVEYLVVAGGGSGGGGSFYGSGGGGAGGLLTGMVPVVAGSSYTVTVGAGGATAAGNASTNPGVNSAFGSITAIGGGSAGLNGSGLGGTGGSGSGGGTDKLTGGQGTAGQGNAGGAGLYATGGGGGGGAGSIGLPPIGDRGGRGGAGIASAISGMVNVYAGGGGGGITAGVDGGTLGQGGIGGGGLGGRQTGSSSNVNGSPGNVNTGGGGGASGGFNTNSGGAGGSGIVIVRYPGTVQFYTGGTVNYADGYIIHTFYSNGTLAPTTPTQYSSTYQISRSLRFNSADTAYLNRTPATAGNRRTWTLSFWIKKTANGASYTNIFGAAAGASNRTDILWHPSDYLRYYDYENSFSWFATDSPGSANWNLYRDVSAWYHIVIAVDTTQANNTDRVKGYINGSFVPGNMDTYTQNAQTQVNSTVAHNLGAHPVYGQNMNAYLTDVHLIDGQQLTASSFGEYDVNTGVWIPRAYGGSYGTNGFKLNFSDNSNVTAATLGADSSGNGNNWTPNNFSVTAGNGNDSYVDTPTPYGTDTGVGGEVRGNYCTLNPLAVHYATLTYTNGNLEGAATGGGWSGMHGTIGVSTGKWYWEVTLGGGVDQFIGIARTTTNFSLQNPQNISGVLVYYMSGGTKRIDGTETSYGASFTTGDTVGVALDLGANTITFYKNNVSQGAISLASTTLSGTTIVPFSAVATLATNSIYNFGQRAFAYTAPSGFKALCTTNLPTPTIGTTAATQANKFFAPITYTGAGGTQAVNVGFQPDFVWMKGRNATTGNILQNVLSGVTKGLQTEVTSSEFTDATTLTEFNSAGFKVSGNSQTNLSGTTYVAWNWKAGGTGVTNTAGSITSTVSANPTSGFSIVTYTGVTGGTVGHGIGVAPSMIIVKNRGGAQNWFIYHVSNGATQYMTFSEDAPTTSSGAWANTSPTSSVFTTGSFFNTNSMLAYCFAPVEGYSAFGSYGGNNNADGAFVYTGFRPAFIMLKRTDSSGYVFYLFDTKRNPFNLSATSIYPSLTSGEGVSGVSVLDILSNGFKLRGGSGGTNPVTGSTMIYAAFAENPFKYSLAR